MQGYVVSLGVGLLVGVFYGMTGVRSPAPPIIALVGLLGIVAGESAVPFVKHLIGGHPPGVAWAKTGHGAIALGRLPGDAAVGRSETGDQIRAPPP
jgi:XapX domain-containing protein